MAMVIDEKDKTDKIIEECEGFRCQLITYCRQYGCTNEEAEDCVAETYRKLVEKLYSGTVIVNHKAYLYKIAINEAKHLKLEQSKNRIIEFSTEDEKQSVMERLSVEIDYIDQAVTEQKVTQCAVKILSFLSAGEMELYIKYYRESKRLNVIASELGISRENARKQKQRLKEKLKALVNEYGDTMYVNTDSKGGEHNE